MRKPMHRKAMRLRAVAAVALLLAGVNAHAVGLLEAYRLARGNDPTFRVAAAERQAGQEYRIQARAGLLPALQASYYIGKNRSDIERFNAFTNQVGLDQPAYISRSGNVQLRQPLVNLEAIAAYKQGMAQTKYTEAQFDQQAQEMALRVVGAYMDTLYAGDQLRLAIAQRDTLAEQQRVNERMFKLGEGTKTDMLEIQARLDVAEAVVLETRDTLTTARNTLEGLIGRPANELDKLPDGFRLPVADVSSYDSWAQMALKSNPELVAQTQAIEAARQGVNRSRAGHAPRLDFVGSYGRNASEAINTIGQESTVRSIGVQLTVPLYSGGAVSSSARQAVANLERARAEYEARKDKLLVDLRRQYNLITSSAAKVAALEKAVSSSRELIKATSESIKGGVRINLDLLNAQQQLYSSQRDLAQARYNFLLSLLRLRSDAGTLTERDIQEIAGYFTDKG